MALAKFRTRRTLILGKLGIWAGLEIANDFSNNEMIKLIFYIIKKIIFGRTKLVQPVRCLVR